MTRFVSRFHLCLVGLALMPNLAASFSSTESLFSSSATKSRNTGKSTIQEFRASTAPSVHKKSEDDEVFRFIRQKTPVSLQYFLRDSGLLRFLADSLTWTTVAPALIRQQPKALARVLHLSGFPLPLVRIANAIYNDNGAEGIHQCFDERVNFQRLQYGSHPRQYIDLMQLCSESIKKQNIKTNLVLFVHGGAWGSGSPDMYRLMAAPFLQHNAVVAMTGYRTYPDGNVQDQANDVVASLRKLKEDGIVDENTRVTLMAHSSGAHVSSLALLSDAAFRASVDCFVGLAGVYDIPSHYQHERLRGVERFSPMGAACAVDEGMTTKSSKLPGLAVLQSWKRASPTRMAERLTSRLHSFPQSLVLHGADDTTVPVTSPLCFTESLQRATGAGVLDLTILPEVGHVDFVTDMMFGGVSRCVVMNWMAGKGVFDC